MEDNKQNITTVNGVPLTDEMLGVLDKWAVGEEENYISHIVEKLSELQDYFCKKIAECEKPDASIMESAEWIGEIYDLRKSLIPFAKPLKVEG